MRPILMIFALLTGCQDDSKDPSNIDSDGDGQFADVDCNDADPNTYIGALEQCDGVDNDCNGQVDDRPANGSIYYEDEDGDGFGNGEEEISACSLPSGYVEDTTDCNDADANAFPGADETCNEADDDCDGETDEDPTDAPNWFEDADGDGYGNPVAWHVGCEAPSGYVEDNTDCDDTDATVFPEMTWYDDNDYDGYGDPATATPGCTAPWGYVLDGSDCDDTDGDIHPGATEMCNGVDDDCDASTPEMGKASTVSASGVWTDQTSLLGSGTLQNAIEMPLTWDGETWLCAGDWYVEFDVQADHWIGSPAGAGATTLRGDESGSAVSIETDGVALTLEGLTIADSTGARSGSSYAGGGGLFCYATAAVDIENVSFENNHGTDGGAIYTEGCNLDISDTVFDGNEANVGAGIASRGNTTITISDSDFKNNVATTSGGGLFLNDYSGMVGSIVVDIFDTKIHGNSATYGGGIWMDEAEVSCTGSSSEAAGIWSNTASSHGGGVRIFSSDGTIFQATNCDFGESSTDNDPNDVEMYGGSSYDAFGDDANFICTISDGCI